MTLLYLNIWLDKEVEERNDKMLCSVMWCILKTYLFFLFGGVGLNPH
jgi:hypothetical protein